VGWFSALLTILRAIPEILRLINSISEANKKKKARDEWEEFEKKFKERQKDEEANSPK